MPTLEKCKICPEMTDYSASDFTKCINCQTKEVAINTPDHPSLLNILTEKNKDEIMSPKWHEKEIE